ncbi:hypothetical protein PABG_11885 [Paracoccidioides brasiliensis Pb03]|nr:hypothetical protein PABG_11885 [Paracoccidioides brasiliensis Pb03]
MSLSQESHIQLVIAVYKSQIITSKMKAAKIHKVSKPTLHKQLADIKSHLETYTIDNKLTEIEEKTLLKFIYVTLNSIYTIITIYPING